MALFKCSKCGVIENHSLVNPKHLKQNYDLSWRMIPGEMVQEKYPNMSLMEMQGHDDKDITMNGQVWKSKDEVMMLCCLCNTGVHHNEFDRVVASEEETEVASYSKYNYTTPAEQSVELEETDTNSSRYRVKKIQKRDSSGKMFLAAVSTMVDLDNIIKATLGDEPYKKPHWKELQTDSEREDKLNKAKEKRERKKNKSIGR